MSSVDAAVDSYPLRQKYAIPSSTHWPLAAPTALCAWLKLTA